MQIPKVGIVEVNPPERIQAARQPFGFMLGIAGPVIDPQTAQMGRERRPNDLPNAADAKEYYVPTCPKNISIRDIDEDIRARPANLRPQCQKIIGSSGLRE